MHRKAHPMKPDVFMDVKIHVPLPFKFSVHDQCQHSTLYNARS
jgi:hypothetical protein